MNDKYRTCDSQLYIHVLDSIEDGVIAIDTRGTIVLFNPAAQVCTGFSERQGVGKSFETLFSGQDDLLYLVRTAVREGRSVSKYENLLLRRPNGTTLAISVSVSPIYNRKGDQEGVVMILRNLSRIRDLEEAVRRADRLSMLGTLAAGLAHEIKNPLGGIKGAAQLLAIELKGESQLQEYTDVMVREVERVNGLIEELMDLARPRPPCFSEVNLAKILGDIVLFQKEAHRKKDVAFKLNLDPSIPPIKGDENLLTRLFLNLIKNAAEALRSSGEVEIITKVASDYSMHKEGERPAPLILVQIKDNGKGIAADEIDRIFTPLYTTKSNGTGLGLAICQKIVHAHQGFLKVKSEPDVGTVFSIYLPFLR